MEEDVCEMLTTAIVEAGVDKHCGRRHLACRADGGVSPEAPFLSAT